MAENKAPKAEGAGKAMSKSAVYQTIANETGLTKKQVASFFEALAGLMKRELGKKGPGVVNVVPGYLQLKVRRMPATKARKGISPFTRQETVFKAKPARNVVKPRALKSLKDLVK